MINLAGFGAGLGFAVLFIGFFEYRDKSLRTEDDVQRILKAPVLAVVPEIHQASDRVRRQVWRAAAACAVLLTILGCATVLAHTFRAIR
jgi:hypothetical protein